MDKRTKKLLTIEDLVQFCQTQNFNKFSSAETGYQLSVQVPAIATYKKEEETKDSTLLFCKVKLFHIGRNRNGSSVTKEAAEKSLSTIAYKPLLANFCEIDGEKDFTSHDMIFKEDGSIEYIERQIGSFTADKPYIEYDEENDKEFVYAYAAIPLEYTDAAEIIERKEGTKISVELIINSMSYNAAERVLELEDIIVQGATCLGVDPETGEEIGEGMKGARLDIVDFSVENNSLQFNSNKELLDEIKKLNENLSRFNINLKLEEGGDAVTKFEELLKKYNKTVDDITFDYENLSGEDLEAKFAEVFGEDTDGEGEENQDDSAEENQEPTSEGDEGDNSEIENAEEETTEDESVEDETADVVEENEEDNADVFTEEVKPEKYSITMSNGVVKEFALSLDEINYALYWLVNNTYSEADNAWYNISVYEDGTLVMYDWWTDKAFRQSYKREEDNFYLTGDRVSVKQIWVTDEEEASLNEMKSNYAALVQFKADAENAELRAQKEAILYNEKYSVIAEKDENSEYKNASFAKLVSEMDNYSLTDLEKELKSVFADYITNGGQFAYVGEEKPVVSKKMFATSTGKKSSRYGNLFNK